MQAGNLKEFMVRQGGGTTGYTSGNQGNTLPLPLGIIEVIHEAFVNTRASCR